MSEKHWVSYIVLNWKLPDKTLAAIKSIRDQAEGSYEIIVVDNESSPESVKKLQGSCDRLITNKVNLGFAAACNQAAKVAKGSYLAFINNDAILPSQWTTHGLRVLKEKVDAASASGGEKVDKIRTYSTSRVSPWTGMVYQNTMQVSSTTRVPYSYGSNLLISAKRFWEVEGFEASYFAYYEDLDLGAKLMSKGWTNWYVPEMDISHKPGSSTAMSKSTLRNRLIQRNKYRFIARQYNHWFGIVLYSAFHDVLSFVVKSAAVMVKPHPRGVRAARLSVYWAQFSSVGWMVTHLKMLAISRRQNKPYYRPQFRDSLQRGK